MNIKKYFVPAIAALSIAIGTALLWNSAHNRPSAPATTFTLLDGTTLSSRSLEGKVVLVTFWSTGCATCVHEMPQVVEMQRLFQSSGYETVAVAMAYDDFAYIRRFVASRGLPFPVSYDRTGEMARRFGDVRLTPTSILVDKHGRLVARYVGEPDFRLLRERINGLLAES